MESCLKTISNQKQGHSPAAEHCLEPPVRGWGFATPVPRSEAQLAWNPYLRVEVCSSVGQCVPNTQHALVQSLTL